MTVTIGAIIASLVAIVTNGAVIGTTALVSKYIDYLPHITK